MTTTLSRLIPDIQVAVGPVILISGVGLLLLTMTNRYGRIIDRARVLAERLPGSAGADRAQMMDQIAILRVRARVMRRSITLATFNVFFVSVLIIVLFLASMLEWEAAPLLVALFVLGLLCLIASLIEFIRDVFLSLNAVEVELTHATGGGRAGE